MKDTQQQHAAQAARSTPTHSASRPASGLDHPSAASRSNSAHAASLQRMVDVASNSARAGMATAQREATSGNGLPDTLKSGIETLSGMSMDHVKVHTNSPEPARIHAHAYTQGSNIYLAPGQEKHLAHEAWHVVQQAQGRVKPTLQMKSGVQVNDDGGLEAEADAMGERAMAVSTSSAPMQRAAIAEHPQKNNLVQPNGDAASVVQCFWLTFDSKIYPDINTSEETADARLYEDTGRRAKDGTPIYRRISLIPAPMTPIADNKPSESSVAIADIFRAEHGPGTAPPTRDSSTSSSRLLASAALPLPATKTPRAGQIPPPSKRSQHQSVIDSAPPAYHGPSASTPSVAPVSTGRPLSATKTPRAGQVPPPSKRSQHQPVIDSAPPAYHGPSASTPSVAPVSAARPLPATKTPAAGQVPPPSKRSQHQPVAHSAPPAHHGSPSSPSARPVASVASTRSSSSITSKRFWYDPSASLEEKNGKSDKPPGVKRILRKIERANKKAKNSKSLSGEEAKVMHLGHKIPKSYLLRFYDVCEKAISHTVCPSSLQTLFGNWKGIDRFVYMISNVGPEDGDPQEKGSATTKEEQLAFHGDDSPVSEILQRAYGFLNQKRKFTFAQIEEVLNLLQKAEKLYKPLADGDL